MTSLPPAGDEPQPGSLAQRLADRIREHGPMPFAAFMDAALYDPDFGYYSTGRNRIGAQGDYYTSPVAHPVFGLLLAQQLQDMWEAIGRPHRFWTVELGAGTLQLTKDIMAAVPRLLPAFGRALRYVAVELATPREDADLRGELETVLAAALDAGLVTDAVIAESGAQRAQLWRLREEHSEAQKLAGASVKNDVSVPVSKVPELICRATEACEHLLPGIRVVPFGHLGDGNIHVNLVQPEGADAAEFLAHDHALMDAVNRVVRALDGSFSAEHGIGRLKPYMMPEWRGGAELDIMRRIKAALDPQGLMNPGKVLPSD